MTIRGGRAEETRQCGYHFGGDVEGCRLVQLSHAPRLGEWQSPIWVCPDCREYLRGYFRYARAREERIERGAFRGPDEFALAWS